MRIKLALSLSMLFNAGVCLSGAGAPSQLRAQEVAATTPTDIARGIELYNQGKSREAAGVLRAAVKQRKDDAQAWLHLGIALTRAGESKDARKAFEKALKLSPVAPQPHIGMAYLHLESGKVEDAERAAARAVALDARNAEAHYALGLVYLRKGAPTQALAKAEETLKINPTFAGAFLLKVEASKEAYAAAYSERAEKYRKLNQPVPEISSEERGALRDLLVEATLTLERYLKLFPASPNIATVREQAETLRLHSETMSQSDEPLVYNRDTVTTKANIFSKPEPLYTEQARQKQISGTVRLRMVLSFDGRVRHILVLRGLRGGLTEMSVNAARGIRFKPATKDGRPVSQFVTIEYNFNIY